MIGPYLLQDGTPGGVVAFYYSLFCLPHANNPILSASFVTHNHWIEQLRLRRSLFSIQQKVTHLNGYVKTFHQHYLI